jgi:hypothetical protein
VGRTIYDDKHFVTWSGNSSKQWSTLFKVNGHRSKSF